MQKERYIAYPAVISDEGNQQEFYTVTFPDVPGAISQGHGIAEALKNGAETLGLILYDAEKLPTISDIEKVKAENSGAIVNYIGVDLEEFAEDVQVVLVRKNTTIPADLAE